MKSLITLIYFIFLVAHIGLCEVDLFPWAQVLTKAGLMPLLIIGVWRNTPASQLKFWIISGLVCSWFGDVFLAFDHQYPLLFIFGLGSFLIAHFIYIKAFCTDFNSFRLWGGASLLQFIVVTLLLGFAGSYYVFLFPSLGALTIPVFIYVLTITTMAITAIFRKGRTTLLSFWLVTVGALCFVLSDSLLAYNKFISSLPHSVLLVMSTYGIAQWCIANGTIATR